MSPRSIELSKTPTIRAAAGLLFPGMLLGTLLLVPPQRPSLTNGRGGLVAIARGFRAVRPAVAAHSGHVGGPDWHALSAGLQVTRAVVDVA